METNVIHLSLCFDENYVTPFYVLLTSLFANNTDVSIHFHVIATGLTNEQRREMESFVKSKNGMLFFYNLTDEHLRGLVIHEGHNFTIATYYRLFLAALVPDYVRNLLYIDTDTIVIGSLNQLCNMDLGQAPAAAVLDAEMWERPELDVDRSDYFNAGVLLINVHQWRNLKVSERAIQFARDFPERLYLADQDALNAVLRGNWVRLPLRYNVMKIDVPFGSRKVLNAFVKDKTIIHFTGPKPWNYECRHMLRHLYHNYHALSPRANQHKYLNYRLDLKVVKALAINKAIDTYFELPFIGGSWRQIKRVLGRQ
jgi:lipopolysaccharide biosynthesis glycosyltransferase